MFVMGFPAAFQDDFSRRMHYYIKENFHTNNKTALMRGVIISFGATGRLRPDDLTITNRLLYQLSYGGL
jgi:hypothetical protein